MQDENDCDTGTHFPGSAAAVVGMQPVNQQKLAAVYGHDSEVGRMMAKLYGKQQYALPSLKLSYREMQGPQPRMVALASRPEFEDPRKRTINRAAIAEVEETKPPAVVVKEVHVSHIESVKGCIRSKSTIERRKQHENQMGDIPQVPIRAGRNTEMEKRKLSLLFALKGGSALPEAGLPAAMDGPLPMHLLTGQPAPGARARMSAQAAEGQSRSSPLYEEYRRTYGELTTALADARAYWDDLASIQGGLSELQAREAGREEDKRVAELKGIAQAMRKEEERIQSVAKQ